MEKKYWIVLMVVILIAAIACGAYFLTSGQSDNQVVRVGYLPSDHNAALFVAQAQKQYEKNNITVVGYQFNNGGDLMTAMASGDIDIGYVGITPALASIQKGVPVKVVSGIQTEGSALVVASDSDIHNVTQLKGKEIATPGESSIQHMLLAYELSKHGMSIDDVSVTAMKVPFMSNSLRADQVDGICTYEPYVSLSTNIGYGKVLASSHDILPDHPCCVIVASDDFIDKHPDTLKTMLDIHKNSTIYVNEHPDEAAKLIPQDIVSDGEIEAKSLKDINFIYGLNDTYKASVTNFMRIEVNMGLLKQILSNDEIYFEF